MSHVCKELRGTQPHAGLVAINRLPRDITSRSRINIETSSGADLDLAEGMEDGRRVLLDYVVVGGLGQWSVRTGGEAGIIVRHQAYLREPTMLEVMMGASLGRLSNAIHPVPRLVRQLFIGTVFPLDDLAQLDTLIAELDGRAFQGKMSQHEGYILGLARNGVIGHTYLRDASEKLPPLVYTRVNLDGGVVACSQGELTRNHPHLLYVDF